MCYVIVYLRKKNHHVLIILTNSYFERIYLCSLCVIFISTFFVALTKASDGVR